MRQSGSSGGERSTQFSYLLIEELKEGRGKGRRRNTIWKYRGRIAREKCIKCRPEFFRLLDTLRDKIPEVHTFGNGNKFCDVTRLNFEIILIFRGFAAAVDSLKLGPF